MSTISTNRVDLITATPEFVQLLIAHEHARAGGLLNVVVPAGWPNDVDARAGLPFHLKALQNNPCELFWRIRLIVWRANRNVIGSINLKGPPDESGTVEVGWGVSPEYRRQGVATEATGAVIEWTFSQPGVERVIATIPADNIASIQVAARLGMHRTGEIRRDLPVWALNRS